MTAGDKRVVSRWRPATAYVMFMRFSERASKLEISSTLVVMNEAQRMRASGIDVVDLSIGEPDFPTPEHIKAAAKRALDENFTKYTNASGIPELRSAIAERYEKDYGVRVKPSQVMASVGGKQALFNALVALVDPGDEVILHAPYWVSFPQMVLFADGKSVYVLSDIKNGFNVSAADIAEKITRKTKAIIINSPCNPTGAVLERREFEKVVDLAIKHDLFLISDDCYDKFLYDGLKPFSTLTLGEEARKRIVVVGTLSKTYSMTGWRLGYAIGSEEMITQMIKIQSQSTSNPSSISQKAAIEALRGPQECVQTMISEYQRRRDYLVAALNQIPGVRCATPQGAFYLFPDISAFLGGNGMADSEAFSRRLLEQAHVAVVSGLASGVDGFIRISYAAAFDRLKEGVARMREFLAAL